MATHTLSADTNMASLTLATSGDQINLNGYTLTCDSDLYSYRVWLSGTGTFRLLDGGRADISYNPVPKTVKIEAGAPTSVLPARGGHGWTLNPASWVKIFSGGTNLCPITSFAHGNINRPQFAKVLSATATEIVIDRDMELSAGDFVAINPILAQSGDPNFSPFEVAGYSTDGGTYTITTASRSFVPLAGAQCVLVSASFVVEIAAPGYPNHGLLGDISGDEIAIFSSFSRSSGVISCSASVRRLVYVQSNRPYVCFGPSNRATLNCGIFCSNSACGNIQESGQYGTNFSANIGKAYCPSLAFGYDSRSNNFAQPCSGRGVRVGGGDVSIYPVAPYGFAEYIDTGLPSSLYTNLLETSELVIRTTSPETCTIHRAGGIATLVKKGGDTVMQQAPVASAYQLAPTGTDAVWHDQAVTVEAGARLTIAWRAFCSIGAVGGVQILADSPLFGQVAVLMGMADVLAEYTESTPPLGVWGPSRLLSWRNTSGQPARVWVRGWGKGGIVYSSAQEVRGGRL